MKKLILIVAASALIVVGAKNSYCETYWAKSYGGTEHDYAASIRQTPDGDYLVAGHTYSFGNGYYDVWVLKLDSNGNILWQKTYGSSTTETTRAMELTSEGGCVVAAVLGDPVILGDDADIWLIKLDKDGNIEWQKKYNQSRWDSVTSIQQTPDNGYIVLGRSRINDDYDTWILKLDKNGVIQWQNLYRGSNDEFGNCLIKTANGEYAIGGLVQYVDYQTHKIWANILMLKLDSDGNIIWQKQYGAGKHYAGTSSIQQTQDGEFIIAGGISDPEDYLDSTMCVLKLDDAGNLIWQKTYGGSVRHTGLTILQSSDKNYIMAGEFPTSENYYKAWLLKLNQEGEVLWQKTYGGEKENSVSSIVTTDDDGFIMTGYTSSFPPYALYDVWVLKMDRNGDMPGCNIIGTGNPIIANALLAEVPSGITLDTASGVSSDTNVDTQNSLGEMNVICENYTLVNLASFTAAPYNHRVVLRWVTASEIDNDGFNIYRSKTEGGEYIKINSSIIPAQGSATQGASYEYVDTDVQNRKTYYYKLEDRDLNGTSTMHGLVRAMPRLIYGMGK